jgi:D-glycero-alpha-D-manno-heptose-7-phosphate kinase
MPEGVEARAPTRIDLAGGTIDIWPLHLLHDRPLTVNAAIDLFATARVERVEGGGVEILSHDRGAGTRHDSLERLSQAIATAPADLEFPMRLVAYFLGRQVPAAGPRRAAGCRVTTDCQAPAGSGLGGSSTLGIALASALDRFVGSRLDGERILALTRAVETQVLRIPTGEQDYHPALRGGVLALHYTVEGTRVERLEVDPEILRRRTVLAFTGVSRSSGISNWDMLKRHIDGDPQVRSALERVNAATHAMRAALLNADWDAAGVALAEEWEARKRLSPAVTTPGIDRLIEAGRAAGALAGKVCGAGGGGCLVLWTREGRKEAAAERLAALGATILDHKFVSQGVSVTEM